MRIESVDQNQPKHSEYPTSSNSNKLIKLGTSRFEPGYWLGMRQSSVQVVLLLTRLDLNSSALRRFDEVLTVLKGHSSFKASAGVFDTSVSQHPVLGRVLQMTLGMLEKMGMPVMGGATAMKPEPEANPWQWLVGLPAISENVHAPQAAFGLACLLMNELSAGKIVRLDAVEAAVKRLEIEFRPLAPGGMNTLHFLQAAHEMEIPWRHVANNVYQFGWGALSRWLDSSFTDETSTISAGLARDKVACAKVLRDAGLPVPRHKLVNNADQAIKVAKAFGYPVVVKPANLDGGLGVLAGVRTAENLLRAYSAAAKLSSRVLVEQFVDGNDYRIRVCKDQVIGVVARRPASVVGNGVDSVYALINRINDARAAFKNVPDPEIEMGFKPIIIDDEVHEWLSYQGFDLQSIIDSGQRVRLRGAANITLGGTTWDVMRNAHAENLALAVKAVKLLRLDVAGVDVLLPDISQPWQQAGGFICEVNGQPQLPKGNAHKEVLQLLVRQQGRIPVVAIESSYLGEAELNSIKHSLKLTAVNVLVATDSMQCRSGLQSSDVDVVLVVLNEYSHDTIWPFDILDLLVCSSLTRERLAALGIQTRDGWLLDDELRLKTNLEDRLTDYLRERTATLAMV